MRSFAPTRRAWLGIGIAFLAGLLLFLLIWAKQRNEYDFYRVDGATQGTEGQQFEPLPVPDTSAPGSTEAPAASEEPSGEEEARIVEDTPAPPPPREQAPPPAPRPAPDVASAGAPDTAPVPVTSPAPRYPRDALRRGESGETLLRIHVGADGVPGDIDLVRSSGSRSLDRAATDAVRKWRFRPARRNGQPVPAEVQVPISFNSAQ